MTHFSVYDFTLHKFDKSWHVKVYRGGTDECYGWVEYPRGGIADFSSKAEAMRYLAYAYEGKDYLVH